MTVLRWAATAGNLITCVIAIEKIRSPYSHDDPMAYSALLVLLLLNLLLVWSPIREMSNYFSLKMRRKALEEQRKIDELEIVELNRPK